MAVRRGEQDGSPRGASRVTGVARGPGKRTAGRASGRRRQGEGRTRGAQAAVASALAAGVFASLLLLSCSDPARKRFEAGEKALLEQRMEAALSAYRSIPRDFPQSRYAPAALLRQGDLLGSYYRNYAAAVEAYESLVFNYPRAAEAPQAHLRRAEVFLFQFANAAAAVEVLEMVRRRYPESERGDEVLLLLAKAYGRLPDFGRQEAVLTELIDRYPASPRAAEGRWMKAFGCLAAGKFGEAEREFRKILYLAADRTDIIRARWGLGQALEGIGDFKRALEQYEAIRNDWEDPAAVAAKIVRLEARIRAR